jgi:hypothetical protein
MPERGRGYGFQVNGSYGVMDVDSSLIRIACSGTTLLEGP